MQIPLHTRAQPTFMFDSVDLSPMQSRRGSAVGSIWSCRWSDEVDITKGLVASCAISTGTTTLISTHCTNEVGSLFDDNAFTFKFTAIWFERAQWLSHQLCETCLNQRQLAWHDRRRITAWTYPGCLIGYSTYSHMQFAVAEIKLRPHGRDQYLEAGFV